MKTLRFTIEVTVADDVYADDTADAILALLSTDPDDACPMIETVDDIEPV
jgi:hypothetical protein